MGNCIYIYIATKTDPEEEKMTQENCYKYSKRQKALIKKNICCVIPFL